MPANVPESSRSEMTEETVPIVTGPGDYCHACYGRAHWKDAGTAISVSVSTLYEVYTYPDGDTERLALGATVEFDLCAEHARELRDRLSAWLDGLPRRRQPERCECGEVARYRYSRGLSEHLACSGCPEPGSGWDGPWHLCDRCGNDCDPRDGFRCPACRGRVGAPEDEEDA